MTSSPIARIRIAKSAASPSSRSETFSPSSGTQCQNAATRFSGEDARAARRARERGRRPSPRASAQAAATPERRPATTASAVPATSGKPITSGSANSGAITAAGFYGNRARIIASPLAQDAAPSKRHQRGGGSTHAVAVQSPREREGALRRSDPRGGRRGRARRAVRLRALRLDTRRCRALSPPYAADCADRPRGHRPLQARLHRLQDRPGSRRPRRAHGTRVGDPHQPARPAGGVRAALEALRGQRGAEGAAEVPARRLEGRVHPARRWCSCCRRSWTTSRRR